MNDKDKEAFEKWWGNIYSNQIEWRDWQGCDIALNGKEDMRYGWQAACLHKQKEIDELIKQLKHEHDLYKKHLKVYEDENAKLRLVVDHYAQADDVGAYARIILRELEQK